MKQLKIALLSAALLVAPAASASTLLTNGVPVRFILPRPAFSGQFFGGDLGYAIYVPPGATALTVELVPDTPAFVADLLVRFSAEVGFSGVSRLTYDYVAAGGAGAKQVVVDSHSSPPLQTGTYFIGFRIISDSNPALTLTATVDGTSVRSSRTVAVSTFDGDLDGWVRNLAPSDLPAASQGDPDSALLWQPEGGKSGGFALHYKNGITGLAALLAPAKFLGNLAALTEPRFEFDFLQIASEPVNAVEIRIFGADAAFSWTGSIPPSPPLVIDTSACTRQILNPITNVFHCVTPWTHYSVGLQPQFWGRLTGEAGFTKALSDIKRIEVIMDLAFYGQSNGIDNFALLSRDSGPPSKVLAGNTSFVGGADGWGRNYPASELPGATTGNADSTFRWTAFEGNPGGYIRLNNAGGANRDYLVVPPRFLGDYRDLPNGRLEFDYEHISQNGATRPVEIRLIGAQSVFLWTGLAPTGTWTHYVAPLQAVLWRRVSGSATFTEALANVERIEISADQAEGPESNGIDNFWVLPGAITPAPPAISANPAALSFSATAGGSNPAVQSISVTSIGGGVPLSFNAAASADTDWLRISSADGTTPRSFNVWADIRGLREGTYSGRVTVNSTSANLGPQTVSISLAVKARSGPTPRINTGGIVNAASGRTQLAPGALGTLYGTGLGSATAVLAAFVPGTTSLPTRLQGVRVLVNETYGALISEAPLLYASDTQINFQLPFETFGRSAVLLVVDNNGALSEPRSVQVVPASPGIFIWGENRAVAVNEDGALNSQENAAARGSVLTVYSTGQGTVTPTVPTGSAAPSRPLARAPFATRAWIGGAPAQILFVGLTPGLVGVLQINLVVPSSAPSGDAPLLIDIAGWNSNAATVSVR